MGPSVIIVDVFGEVNFRLFGTVDVFGEADFGRFIADDMFVEGC
jgi:hypothetical protein